MREWRYYVREAVRALGMWTGYAAYAAVALIVLWAVVLGAASAADMGYMNKVIDSSNVLVNSGCSGTRVDDVGDYILTAYHCVGSQYETVTREKIGADGTVTKEKVRVAKPGTVSQFRYKGPNEVQKNSYLYKIKATDSALDLALLQTQASIGGIVPAMACAEPVRGDKVIAVGNSYAVLYATVTEGIVSSMSRSYRDLQLAGALGDETDDGEHGLIQHSAVIAGGNSGGALYNDNGEFIGVNVRGAASGFSFAVPLQDIRKFLSMQQLDHLWKHCAK